MVRNNFTELYYKWYTNTNQEAEGGDFVTAATNYQDATVGDASPSTTNIIWNATGLNTVTPLAPLFLVIDYSAPAVGGCANNMKVYPIVPQNGFTVDIYNLDQNKANPVFNTSLDVCSSNIKGASYNGTAIVTDYGTNYLYYEVVAANFSGSWTPTMAVSGLDASQSYLIEWSYDNTFATIQTGDVTTLATNTSNGVSIFVRVTVNNSTFEGLADKNVVLTVNGESNSKPDVTNTDCTASSATDDQATQKLLARPTVTSVPASTFITN